MRTAAGRRGGRVLERILLIVLWLGIAMVAGCAGESGTHVADGGGDEADATPADGADGSGFDSAPDGGGEGGPDDMLDGGVEDGADGNGGFDGADGAEDGAGDAGEPLDPALPGGPAGTRADASPTLAGCLDNGAVPLAIYLPAGSGPFPVVILHHGFQLESGMYASYGEHLASWGYLVIMPQFPGGLFDAPTHRQLKDCLIALLDWVEQHAAEAGGPLLGKADAARIALSGHSMGGKISLYAATEDTRPRAVIGLDPVDAAGGAPGSQPTPDRPSVTPELMDRIQVPLLLLGETVNATCTGFMCQACAPEEDNFHQYYQYAVSPALEIEVVGANHMSFLDNPDCGWVCSVCPKGSDDPAETRRLSRRYLTAFLNVVLRGEAAYRTYLTGSEMNADVAAGRVRTQSKNGF
jgi:chlorophyllase